MAGHRELAGDLRDRIAPGDTIVWRSGPATYKIWELGLLLVLTIMVAILGLALWLRPFGAFDWPYRYLWLAGALIAFIVCILIPILTAGAAVVLTETEIYIRGYFPGGNIQRFARSDFSEATVFTGDGTVFLHTANGDQSRLRVGREARDFVEAMAIPAHVWIAHDGPSVGGVILVLLGVSGAILQNSYGFVYDWVVGDGHAIGLHFIFWLFAAFFVLHLLIHWYKARKMDPDERRRTACMMLDPRWRGRDPYTSGNIPLWKIPGATLTLWLIKAIYGMPTDCATGHEPEIIDPHQMAAE